MSTAAGIGADAQDDTQLSTPIASHMDFSPSKESISQAPRPLGERQLSESSTLSSSTLSSGSNTSSGGPLLLPIPNPGSNKSQSSFTLSDDESHSVMLDPLPEEIANADISIAHDGSFIETSSGAAARELKKRYDEHLGVGNASRSAFSISPFAITAFVNQHGTQMYRVGHRQLSPPAFSTSEDAERQIIHHKSASQSTGQVQSSSPSHTRRSRMSMHTFFPHSVFRNGRNSPPSMNSVANDGTRSPPTRKLRKTRSLTNLFGVANGTQYQTVQGPSTTTTGRPHAHSVTGANLHQMPNGTVTGAETSSHIPPHRDVFSDVMQWGSEGAVYSSSASASSDDLDSPPVVHHPFGRGVAFDSPTHRPCNEYLTTSPILREMQSFESGLTARADPEPGKKTRMTLRTAYREGEEFVTPSPPPLPAVTTPEIRASPSLESTMHSRYSTGVFDVLQSYRGLPLLDKLSPTSNETTVIKLSTRSETSAAPKDDPRFVIWGEIYPSVDDALDAMSLSHDSHTDQSSYSGQSRRSMKGKIAKSHLPDPPKVRITPDDRPQKALVAATIERWIAQLTSELNYDELLIFFLTYRTYVSAVDLCHLLICRFHWAVEQSPSLHDDMVKKIVRVRTFIAIRYWLLTFFTVDFVPNRELRLLFANWLNTLSKDPTLENTRDVLDIVRKLKKVAKECKDAQTSKNGTTSNRRFSASQSRKSESVSEDDSDVDLDFLPDGGSGYSGPQSFGVSPTSSMAQSTDMAIMQQPLRLAILQHSKQVTEAKANGPFVPSAATLPFHHGALSRAFVNTIGRLGRWKRVLNSRSSVQAAHTSTVDVSPFDLEPNATGDLLTVRGGVEQYLKMIQTQYPTSPPSLPLPSTHTKDDDIAPPIIDMSFAGERKLSEPLHVVSEETEEDLDSQSVLVIGGVSPSFDRSISPPSYDSDMSRRETFDSLAESGFYQHQPRGQDWQIDVVSIDELELSDMSSVGDQEEPEVPPGLRRVARKLPLRRDFEFVRRSMESVSSFAARTRDSIASASNSIISSASAEPELGSNIQQWQVNALVDSLSDEDEAGDVDAALRHLEGRISHVRQVVKQTKVDSWVKAIRERMVTGDYGDEQSRFPVDDEDEDEDTSEHDVREFGVLEHGSPTFRRHSNASAASGSQDLNHSNSPTSYFDVQSASQHFNESQSGPGSPVITADAKPAIEDVVPKEILQSRVISKPSTSNGSVPSSSTQNFNSLMRSPSSIFIGPERLSRSHRSVLLGYRAAVLAEHFATIERELFVGLKFEELVVDDWMRSVEEANVLDWAQFLKDRARYKAESRAGPKTSALVAFRGRFNLCANFIVSEIVLTHPADRHIIIGKFIRLSWKLYERGSFNTLVAIIAGLRSEWVTRAAKKSWPRIGTWESRMFRDLVAVTSPGSDFRFLRQEVEAAIEAKPILVNPHDTSTSGTDGQSSTASRKPIGDGRVQPRSFCIPFLGIYLSQLYRYSHLPDLIDPTSPNEPVGIDPVTNAFETPAHPEVFSTLAPLPSWMQLEPLINVQKQRLIAGVIKSLVTGQHLASKMQYSIDKKLFQKCLKLKALDQDTLQRALAMYPE